MTTLPLLIDRDEFLNDYWTYRPGEHVTILAPTGAGKTELHWELLEKTATSKVPAVVFASKPRDATTQRWASRLDWTKLQTWPPRPKPWEKKPSGWVLWPKHTHNPDFDDHVLMNEFSNCLSQLYKKGNAIVSVDEALDLMDLGEVARREHVISPERWLRTLWTRGRSMGAGLWTSTQRPFDIPVPAYGQANHLFIAHDPDERSQRRYGEIGGIADAKTIAQWVRALQQYQFLYLRRRDKTACVVSR